MSLLRVSLLRVSYRTLAVISFLFLLAAPILAQITNVTNDQATPIPGVGHDYIKMLSETVQPSNGQLSIRIDVPTLPGRGSTIPFAYLYNSAGLHHVLPVINGNEYWFSDTQPAQGSGWRTTSPAVLSAVLATASKSYPGPPPYTASCAYFTNYVFQDATGARHSLPILAAQSTDVHSPNNCSQANGPSSVLLATDGTYAASTTAPPVDTVPSNPPPVTIADPDGNVYNCSFSPFPAYAGYITYFYNTCSGPEDRNGNSILSQPTISVTTTTENVPWENFSFNQVPAPSNPPQANCAPISSSGPGQMSVNQSINFPNGSAYQFSYDTVYGLVNQITYPSGGYVKYSWGLNPLSEAVLNHDNSGLACAFEYDTPAVTHRYVSFDGVNTALEQDFNYSPTMWNSDGTWTSKQTTVVTIDCARNNFNCSGAPSFTTTYNYVSNGGGLPGQQVAADNSMVYGNFTGNTALTVTKGWLGERLMCELHTLDNGLISGTYYAYSSFADVVTDKKEYDYGLITSTSGCVTNGTLSPPSGVTPTRETTVNYQTFAPTPIFPANNSIFDRPSSVITDNGTGARVAETDYTYDQPQSVCSGYSTCAVSPTPTNHDETYYAASSTASRGNATTITRQCFQGSQGCTNAVATYTFDETGQLLTKVDPCGNAACSDMTATNHTTTYSYTDNYSSCGGAAPSSGPTNAYLTKITDALGHIQSFCYGYNDGQLRGSTDPNGQTTTYTYNTPPSNCSLPDHLDRLSSISYPDGGSTTYCYNDSLYSSTTPSPSITTTRVATPDPNIAALTAFDGLGHTVRTAITSDCTSGSGDRTDTTYDGLGHVYTVSSSYCSTGDSTYGLTTDVYDALGRTTQVIPPDGSSSSNNVSTVYSGNCTTVTDQAGNARKSCSDGLGRLTQVFEDPGSSPHLNLETDYTYDALDNLTRVDQWGGPNGNPGDRVRTFSYNSLSQLTSAANPESATITYAYDANGNLSSKTSPAQNQTGSATVTVSSCYDALNRATSKAYTAQSCPMSSPVATYAYDSAVDGYTMTNAVGRLVKAATSDGKTTTWNSYDPMGRILNQWQCTPFNCGTTNPFAKVFTYDLSGNETSEKYSYTYELAKITYGYDGAARPNLVTSDLVDGNHPATLATVDSSVGYWPTGALRKITFANGLTETAAYNSRLQPCRINVNSTAAYYTQCADAAPTGSVQDFNYGFNFGTADNGSLASWSGAGTQAFNRTYSYDSLNRISSMSSPSDPFGCNGLSWTIDPWGNTTDQTTTSGGCFQHHYAVNTSNQLTDPVNNSLQYDSAGNVTADGSHTYFYDAENRAIQVDGTLGTCSTATACYVYDADGRRAWKTVGSTTTDYIYDLSGNVADEFGPGCGYECWTIGYVYLNGGLMALYTNGTTYFVHKDHLGSTRLVTDLTAAIEDNLDYLPFGEASPSDSALMTHEFTGKERDYESNQDFFGARYYECTLTRFTSPDALLNSGKPWEPQSWNRYSYTLNNPLTFTDPNGLWTWGTCSGKVEQCEDYADRFRDSVKKANEALKNLDPNSKEAKAIRSALKKLGEEGKGDIKVSFGDAGSDKNGNPFLGTTTGHSITINYEAYSAVNENLQKAGQSALSESETENADAGLTTHEATHALGNGIFGLFKGHFEHPAYWTESATYEGLHYNDRAFGLWNESWLQVDKDKVQQNVQQHREQAIQDILHPKQEKSQP